MSAPACPNCDGQGWYEYEGRTSAPVSTPPIHQRECGECDGSGIDWSRTCEMCGSRERTTGSTMCAHCDEVAALKRYGFKLDDAIELVNHAERLIR